MEHIENGPEWVPELTEEDVRRIVREELAKWDMNKPIAPSWETSRMLPQRITLRDLGCNCALGDPANEGKVMGYVPIGCPVHAGPTS